ncbi:MAG TPA: hypothetical protein VGH82_10070 [Gaiellaceae bacterium]|jgi:hypothetical protein
MRRLILQTSVSVDGYVAALDKSHRWGNDGSEDEGGCHGSGWSTSTGS